MQSQSEHIQPWDELIPVPGNVPSVLGDPTLNRGLTSGDCDTAGNFWFCFVHKSRRIMNIHRDPPETSPNFSLVPRWTCAATVKWRTQRSRDSLSDCRRAQRQWAGRCDLFHLSSTLSFAADVDTYGLILKVLHVLNLHICYRPDIWVIHSVTQWCHYVISVIKLKNCFYPKYKYVRFIKF